MGIANYESFSIYFIIILSYYSAYLSFFFLTLKYDVDRPKNTFFFDFGKIVLIFNFFFFVLQRKGTTDGISSAPFHLGFISGSFWLQYGILKNDKVF